MLNLNFKKWTKWKSTGFNCFNLNPKDACNLRKTNNQTHQLYNPFPSFCKAVLMVLMLPQPNEAPLKEPPLEKKSQSKVPIPLIIQGTLQKRSEEFREPSNI